MLKQVISAFLLFVILVNATGCIVTSPYDRHHSRLPRPHAMMRRPRPVKSGSRYGFTFNPFGYSSSQSIEHWRAHRGSKMARTKVWPQRFVPHSHMIRVRYNR